MRSSLTFSQRLLSCILGVLVLAQLAWCKSTIVVINNFTPYTFKLQSIDYENVVEGDKWVFPTQVMSGTAEEADVEYNFNLAGPSTTSASVTYTVTRDDGLTQEGTFDIWLDVTDVQNPMLQSRFNGFTTDAIAEGGTLGLGFEDKRGKHTPFILSGGFFGTSLTGTYPSDSWMQDNLPAIGCRTIREICMPGSHDAAMSEIHHLVGGATDWETLTQTLNINEQLKAGVRYFDIRPAIDGGHYTTGHFNGASGGNGQSMQDIVWNINNFTETNAELIILRFGSSVNRDNKFKTFNDEDWYGLMGWTNEINHLWTLPCTGDCDLTGNSLNDLIGGGEAAVILLNYDGPHSFEGGAGWYNPENFRVNGESSSTIDRDFMRADQYYKLQAARTSPTAEVFELLWTLTSGLNINGVINWANGIYTDLFTADGDSQQSEYDHLRQGILRMTNPITYPNIITTDAIHDENTRLLTALAIGINRLYATCPQVL